MDNNNPDAIKVVLIGDAGTGKTSLLTRWVEDRFDPSQRATIGVAFKLVNFEYENEQHMIQIWDTAGQESFRSTSPLYCRNAQSAMVVFDITSKSSFDSLTEWIQILQQDNDDINFLIVGNKCDLEEREVSYEQASQFAKNLKMEYIETSATKNKYVNEAFSAVASLAINSRKRNSPQTEGVQQIDLSSQPGNKKNKDCC